MRFSEAAKELADRIDLPQQDIYEVLKHYVELCKETLAEGDEVSMDRFCCIEIRTIPSRNRFIPQKGYYDQEEQKTIKIRPMGNTREFLNNPDRFMPSFSQDQEIEARFN